MVWFVALFKTYCLFFSTTNVIHVHWKNFRKFRYVWWRTRGFPDGSMGKESASNAGDTGSILGLVRSLGEGNGNPLQYSCLKNLKDRSAWWATVQRVTEWDTTEWLSTHTHNERHTLKKKKLKYSEITMLCKFQVYSKVIQLCINIIIMYNSII